MRDRKKPSLLEVEAVAWDRLAQAFAYYSETGEHARDHNGRRLTSEGICCALWYSMPNRLGSLFGEQTMVRRARHNKPKSAGIVWWWKMDRAHATDRASFCYRMAQQCRDEFARVQP